MIDIDKWLEIFCERSREVFADRIRFVGIQGSFGRGEQKPGSDIDVVLLLDRMEMDDLRRYDAMLNEIPHRELACGFVSGWQELKNWDAAELFQFYYDTTPIVGDIDELLSVIDEDSVRRSIHTGACGIYHACVHNFLHEKDSGILKGLYKSARFVVQAVYFLQTEEYIKQKALLKEAVSEPERRVMEICLLMEESDSVSKDNFESWSQELILWSGALIRMYHG